MSETRTYATAIAKDDAVIILGGGLELPVPRPPKASPRRGVARSVAPASQHKTILRFSHKLDVWNQAVEPGNNNNVGEGFLSLPPEIVEKIFLHLTPPDLGALNTVSRSLYLLRYVL
jgi:hypothetical protein